MLFMDPCDVTCSECDSTSVQRVAYLFELRAVCPNCGNSFASIGNLMRSWADEFNHMMDTIDIGMNLESKLGCKFIDYDSLVQVKTLRDIVQLVEAQLPSSENRKIVAIDLVFEAVRVLPDTASTPDLDAPLRDAIYPTRWKRAP